MDRAWVRAKNFKITLNELHSMKDWFQIFRDNQHQQPTPTHVTRVACYCPVSPRAAVELRSWSTTSHTSGPDAVKVLTATYVYFGDIFISLIICGQVRDKPRKCINVCSLHQQCEATVHLVPDIYGFDTMIHHFISYTGNRHYLNTGEYEDEDF